MKCFFAFMMFLMLMLTGCAQQTDTSSSVDQESSENTVIDAGITYEDGTPILDFKTRYDKIKEKYPDKTILVWASEHNIRYEDEVNDYLNENNCDYVICFKNITYELEQNNGMTDKDGKWVTSFSDIYQEELKNSEQIDIVSTELMYIGYDGFMNTYQYFVRQGWLEPIDSYLNNTKIGKEFYNSIPQKYWESLKYNGNIYGFDGSLTCLRNTAGYEFNSDLYEKLGIEQKDLKGNYIDTINKIFDICKKNELKFAIGYLEYMSMYTDYDFLTDCVYIDENGKAANIFESNEAKKLFNTIQDGSNNGYNVNMGTTVPQSMLLGKSASKTCGEYLADGTKINSFFSSISTIDKPMESVLVFPKCFNTVHATTTATGISSSSKYKDMAFDAFIRIMSDEKLNNIICFGTDYKIIDGCIDPRGYYNTMDVQNKFLKTPFYGLENSDIKERLNTAFNNSEVSKNIDFMFDSSNVVKQVNRTEKIIAGMATEYPSTKYKTGEDYLKAVNQKLYDAGLQDIIDEANRQLEEFNL